MSTSEIVKQKKSITDYIVTVGSRGANRLLALLISVLIARSLGVEDFALYSLFFGVFILIFQSQAGINIAYVRFVKTNKEQSKEILRLSIHFQLVLLAFLSLASWPLANILSDVLDIENQSSLAIGVISSALLGLYGIWFGYFQEKSQFIYLGVLSLIFNLFIAVLIGGGFVFEYSISLTGIFSTYLYTALSLGMVSLCILWFRSSNINDRKLATEFYKMVGLNLSVTLLYFVYRYIDVYFIKYYSDLETVGIYSAAMKTSMLLNILVGALPTILLPKAVQAVSAEHNLRNYFRKSYILVAAIIACLAIFLWLSPLMLKVLFGEEYIAGSFALQILVLGWMFNAAYIPIAQIFYALNIVKWRLTLEFIKLIITVVAFVLLIPAYGANGAAYSLLAAIVITLIIASVICRIQVKRHFNAT